MHIAPAGPGQGGPLEDPMATALEQEFLDLELQFWTAMRDHDVEAAKRLTDEPCIITGPQGVSRITRDALAAMISSSTYSLDDFEMKKDAQVSMLGDDVAVVAYGVHEDLTVEGKKVSLDALDASTWVRKNGRWVCALHTEAIAGDPFGRDRQSM
jgi:hypothetical protein